MDTELLINERMEKARRIRFIRRSIIQTLSTLLIIYLMLGVVFGVAIVRGESMEPTLKSGALVIYSRLTRTYNRGDIIVLKRPDNGEQLIKRINAVGGERVELYKPADSERITKWNAAELEMDIFTVEEGCVYVLGDNYADSIDSREFGQVPEQCIQGKVIRTFGAN